MKTAARGYDGRWQRARAAFLQAHPMCVLCEAKGRATLATVVDHIRAHRMREALHAKDQRKIEAARKLFWDRSNWQPVCKPCHDSDKQQLEKSGFIRGAGIDGIPTDAGHHWNQSAKG
jgi:5-methylcytosine-specific restriction endonuclease McrA